MNESPEYQNFQSAEQQYEIDPNSGYFRAARYANNPVEYFKNFRHELITEEDASEDELGIHAIGEMQELDEIIVNEKVPLIDPRAEIIAASTYASPEWSKAVFGILKEAGFTKAELMTWVLVDDPEFTSEERMKDRSFRYFLHEVYGDTN